MFTGLDKAFSSLEHHLVPLIQTQLDQRNLRLEMSVAAGSESRVLATRSGLKDGDLICHCPCAFFSHLTWS